MNKYFTIVILVTVVALLVVFRNKLTSIFVKTPIYNNPTITPPPTTQLPASLDRDKVLKKGVTGAEVKMLQYMLAINADGIFGPVTEGALQDRKCVIETTLNTYDLQSCTTDLSFDIDTNGDWSSAETIYNSIF